MLLIVNPMATTVSSRLKNLVIYALRGRYQVEAVETEAQGHAIALTQEATAEGYDLVVAFGGDGTVNEAANGLAGSSLPLALLPGGCTNVFGRMLGIPMDVVDATEHLLALADDLRPRRIDLGSVNGRHFVSSGGIGLDAETARWVDRHAPLKSRAGPFFFAFAAATSFHAKYVGKQPCIAVDVDGERIEGVTAVVQNSDPYTYFDSLPVRVCEGASLDDGQLSMVVFEQARWWDAPELAWRLLSSRPGVAGHRRLRSLTGLRTARVTPLERDDAPTSFPLQVDGDYVGDVSEARFEVHPQALLVVA
jgi:diacylglycerol kinase family enzyme